LGYGYLDYYDFAIVYMEWMGPYSYAPIGSSYIENYKWQAKYPTKVTGALYEKTLFALDYFEKNINGDIFYKWCKYILIRKLKTKYLIVMNNKRFHK